MTGTAKIVRFHQAGGPEVLQIDELPIPEPGAGEVRLRVKAIGLNRAEVMFRYDQYFFKPNFPSKLGYEASGIVEAVGPGVDPGLIGRRCPLFLHSL
jgi:NADPH:quinone reductase-like Zn-dependent oxidoreductase